MPAQLQCLHSGVGSLEMRLVYVHSQHIDLEYMYVYGCLIVSLLVYI